MAFVKHPESPIPTGEPIKRRKRFISVGTKLTSAMLVVLVIVTAFTYLEVSRREQDQLLSAKARSAMMVTELFAAGVTAPLSFGDEPGIREHVGLLMANTNIVYGAVWGTDLTQRNQRGDKLAETTRLPPSAPEAREAKREDNPKQPISISIPIPIPIPTTVEIERTADTLTVEEPVVSASGEVLGVVRVAFSLERENAAIASAKHRALFMALVMGLGLAAVLLALTRTLIVRRLAQLATAAKRLEDGEEADVVKTLVTNDEVGALSRAFTSMAETIAAREARISARNRDMRHILDNVAEGLMTVKKDGTMSDERSRILDEWFGAPSDPHKFFEYFEGFAEETARWLRIGWTALADDCMPVEVIFDQMPRRFEHHGRFYELGYLPIWLGAEADQVLDEVLVVVSDVTSIEKRERAEQAQREAMNIFRRILDDRAGFREFFRQASQLVDSIVSTSDVTRVMRDIHTLKGNTGLYGIEGVAEVCHRVESRVHEDGSGAAPTAEELAQIRSAWNHVCALANELQLSGDDRIELCSEEYDEHVQMLASFASHRELLASVRGWANEPASRRLQRVAEQARSLARRLGKANTTIEVTATPANLRLEAAPWEGFWAVFSHVLRNTFDHGIEPSAERTSAGKSAAGKVSITLTSSHVGIELCVVDDGRGIAWEKIRERAAKLGLPHATAADLEEALYVDKITTQTVATEISGRGVGMGAVREVVRECGGSIAIETSLGSGSTFRFCFPFAMRSIPTTTPSKVA